MRVALALSVALLALTACRYDESAARPAVPEGRQQAARQVAEEAVRSRLRTQAAQMRGVQTFAQALPDTLAVCGRSTVSGEPGSPLTPYVAVISFEGEEARVSTFVLGATGPEATRVFVEMVDRCFEGGGPATTRVMARSYPPLPIPGAPTAEPTGEIVAEAQADPVRPAHTVTVSTRSGANLRSAARGGAVIRTLPPASRLEVVDEAPGGWYRVGQAGSPIGWVHASVLQQPGR